MNDPDATQWLSASPRGQARPAGRVLRLLGKWLAGPGGQGLDGVSAEYFEWQAATAEGVWRYYSAFLEGETRLVLDVCSGASGRTAAHATVSPAAFVCLDRNTAFLGTSRREAARRGLKRLLQTAGDACQLPFPDDTFDAAMCEFALEHLQRPDAAIAEMHRVLRVGGRLFLVFPPWRGPYAGHLRRLTWLPWIHNLPDGLRLALLKGILGTGSDREPLAAGRDVGALVGWLARELNGWPLRRILAAVAGGGAFGLLGAHVLGEGPVGQALRFIPWLGEYFASAVYLVLEKRKLATPLPRTYNSLLLHTVRGALRRRL